MEHGTLRPYFVSNAGAHVDAERALPVAAPRDRHNLIARGCGRRMPIDAHAGLPVTLTAPADARGRTPPTSAAGRVRLVRLRIRLSLTGDRRIGGASQGGSRGTVFDQPSPCVVEVDQMSIEETVRDSQPSDTTVPSAAAPQAGRPGLGRELNDCSGAGPPLERSGLRWETDSLHVNPGRPIPTPTPLPNPWRVPRPRRPEGAPRRPLLTRSPYLVSAAPP